MTTLLHHRGPDSSNVVGDERWLLGNARLKIIDLSDQADLPMRNADGSIWMAYNGEVTNFRRLEEKYGLAQKYPFRSTSDTEVLIHLYEELGIDFLRELSGMFAFTLVDERARRAYIVRDFYGMRPLFYMAKGDRLYFASELKAFMELDRFEGRLDHEAMYHYFSLAYIPDELTPFEEITELLGGELIEVDLDRGAFHRRPYHEITYETDHSMTERDAARELHVRMRDAVERNLISDAPLGLTLSGGFDTSSMVCLTRELDPDREIHTFSIVMDEPSYDESRYQRLVVDQARTVHHEIVVGPDDVRQHLVEQMAYLDEPNGDGAAIPSYLLAKIAKPHVSVLLSGEGGDEVFNAYETHVAYKARHLYRSLVPGPARRLARSVARRLPCDYRKLSFDFLAKRFTEGAELDTPESHLYWRHVLTDPEKDALMPRHSGYRPTASFFRDVYEGAARFEGLDRISLIDLKYFFIGDLMVKNDRTFMASSVEARFPWMDRELFDFVSTIPPRLRIKGLKRRYLQKEAMKDVVPPAIYRRSNMGLEMPHSLWFMAGLGPLIDEYLTREKVEQTGFLSYEAVQKMWHDHRGMRKDNGRALWCVLNLLIWFELFVSEKSYRRYLKR